MTHGKANVIRDSRDGISGTIMLVEADELVPWAKPVDRGSQQSGQGHGGAPRNGLPGVVRRRRGPHDFKGLARQRRERDVHEGERRPLIEMGESIRPVRPANGEEIPPAYGGRPHAGDRPSWLGSDRRLTPCGSERSRDSVRRRRASTR